MNRSKKIAIITGAILIIYSLVGFVAIPLILESVLPGKLSEALNRPVSIQNIALNPFSLTAAVEGVNIKDKNATDPFVSFDKFFINVQTLSLFKLGLVASEVRLEKPDIHIARKSGTEFNFSDLIAPKKSAKKPEATTETPEAKGKAFRFSVSNIAIVDGNISFQDDPVQKKHSLSAINLTLPHISNFDQHIDSYSEPILAGKFNRATISVDVETKPFHDTIETVAKLSLKGLVIPYYFIYVPANMVSFEISNGRLDVDAQVSFLQKDNEPEITVSGTIGLANLEILESNGNTVLKLPELKIDVAPSRPLEHRLTLASVTVQSPELSVTRTADGIINLTTLGPKPAETEETEENDQPLPEPATEAAPPADPFQFEIKNFLLDTGKILFTDFAAGPGALDSGDRNDQTEAAPVEISVDDLVIKVSDFTNAPEKAAAYDIHAAVNREAEISAAGQLGISPLHVESDFNLGNIKLAWAQPYIPENVRLSVADGKLSTSGHASLRADAEGALKTALTGNAAINDFNSVDTASNEAFISWSTFSFDGIDISTRPLKINTQKILLKDFKNQLIVYEDGTVSLKKIFAAPETAEPEADAAKKTTAAGTDDQHQKASPVIPVKIGEVHLENFDFRFIDRNIEPDFTTRLNLSDVRVTGLTSEDFKSAELTAHGLIDDYAQLKIDGKINPLKKDLFLDATYSLTNMELSALSPYTGKYIGRTIEKGKLSSSVAYKIDKKIITAKNHLLLDQFTLGKTVESKDALNLPVGVAIALLKDRNGQINIELPISGRTDDPEFGFGKPLLKALQNLIVKASTSPFDLVSSVVGGGEELRYIEFAAAAADIDAPGTEKLDAVKKLIYERPALKIDISGFVDMQADKEALIDRKLARKIKTRSLGKGAPQDMASLDKMVLSPEDYSKHIREIYIDEVLADPEKKKTLKPAEDPGLTVEDMELQIRRQIKVADAELRQLALDRARQVKNVLLSGEKAAADRIFLTEPPRLSPEKKKGFKAARVELNVR